MSIGNQGVSFLDSLPVMVLPVLDEKKNLVSDSVSLPFALSPFHYYMDEITPTSVRDRSCFQVVPTLLGVAANVVLACAGTGSLNLFRRS